MENPQKENGHTKIANELMDILAKTKFSSQETRILFAVLRKTYGWNKKEDWISNSQLEEVTGIHRSHCVHTVTRLKKRKIIIKKGNKIKFNKIYSQWEMLPTLLPNLLPEQATHLLVPEQAITSARTGNLLVPEQAPTKETTTKETTTKESYRREMTLSPLQKANKFFKETFDPYRAEFIASGYDEKIVQEELENFCDYWTEPNKSGTKERWQLEKTFDIGRRLKKWFKNSKKFNNYDSSFNPKRYVA